jgi:ABC-type ATPase involved in cell division
VSLEIAAGRDGRVAGHSGAGKSTLLKLAAGIERATSGTVVVSGQNLGALGETPLAVLRRRIGFVFQDHKLLYDRSCFDNVALPLNIAGFARDEAARRGARGARQGGLLARERAMPVALSGGEQQRLCIARAIVNRPQLLVADEPTGQPGCRIRPRHRRALPLLPPARRHGAAVDARRGEPRRARLPARAARGRSARLSAWLRMHAHAALEAAARLARTPVASMLSIVVLGIAIALPVVAAVALRSVGAAALPSTPSRT